MVLRFYDGTQTTADPGVIADSEGRWTSAHVLRDTAYMAVQMGFDAKVFSGGVPSITCTIRGKKVYDPRTTSTAWSDNPALCIRDYLTSDYGLGEESSGIDDTLIVSEANICDQMVDGSKRYTCNGAFVTSVTPADILSDILTSLGGALSYSQGKWRLRAAAWSTPSLTLTEDDLRSSVNVNTRHSRRDNFNIVQGTFRGPESKWQVTDYPRVTNVTDTATSVGAASLVIGDIYKINSLGNTDWNVVAGTSGVTYGAGDYVTVASVGTGTGTAFETTNAYLDADNGQESVLDFDLPFTDNSKEARRIARILLERNRQQLTVSAEFGLRALPLRIGDVVRLSVARFGWDEKEFEVVEWSFGLKDGLDLTVNLALREISENVFDNVDDGVVFELDNTKLKSAFFVPDITLAVETIVRVVDNKPVRAVKLTSAAASNAFFVRNVRYYYRLSPGGAYIYLGEAELGEFVITNIPPGTYDFKAIAVSSIGAIGDPVEETDFSFVGPIIDQFGYAYNGAFETLDLTGWTDGGYFDTMVPVAKDPASLVEVERTAPFDAMLKCVEADGVNPTVADRHRTIPPFSDPAYIFLSLADLTAVEPLTDLSLTYWAAVLDGASAFDEFSVFIYFQYFDANKNQLFDETTTTNTFREGTVYKIVTTGTVNWTSIGATAGTVGEVFRATDDLFISDGTAYREVAQTAWANVVTSTANEWKRFGANVTVPEGAFYVRPRFATLDSVNTTGYFTGFRFFGSETAVILQQDGITENSRTAVSGVTMDTNNVQKVIASTTVSVPALISGSDAGQELKLFAAAVGSADFTTANRLTVRLFVDGVNVGSQKIVNDSGFNISAITPELAGDIDVELRADTDDVTGVTITEAQVTGMVLKR
jgi:hypothetical protein